MKKLSTILLLLIAIPAKSDIVHQFKNPSFSGIGTGSHYLTIENQEHSRKKAIEDALEAAEKAAQREADNTTLAKFIRNLESRIYAQLSKQLVDNMFSNEDAVTFGSFTLEGSVVSYEVMTDASGEDYIQMRITDTEGTETVIEIPIGTGNFGSPDDNLDAI
jgi:DNA polymerase III alpha subunit (gram-positive type)